MYNQCYEYMNILLSIEIRATLLSFDVDETRLGILPEKFLFTCC